MCLDNTYLPHQQPTMQSIILYLTNQMILFVAPLRLSFLRNIISIIEVLQLGLYYTASSDSVNVVCLLYHYPLLGLQVCERLPVFDLMFGCCL